MSVQPRTSAGIPAVEPFPAVGPRMALAYRELRLAANGTPEQKRALGHQGPLPRPWDISTCQNRELRGEVWDWLEQVVLWLNSQYVWDVTGMIPACWPQHPHLVHEVAVLADQRRRAGHALDSDELEEWHRYTLPAFTERMRTRLKSHCDDGHQAWPARGRFAMSLTEAARSGQHLGADRTAATIGTPSVDEGRLGLIDLQTGEVLATRNDQTCPSAPA